MSKKQPPPSKPRHLQLVLPSGSPSTDANTPPSAQMSDGRADSTFGALPEGGMPGLRGGWTLVAGLLVAIGVVYVGLHVGASRLKAAAAARFDSRRFSMQAFVRHHDDPDESQPVGEGDSVRTDDTWHFVLHNRSRKNVWFGIFAAGDDGQLAWFYPRNGGGEDTHALPLPAIPTVTLPEGLAAESLTPGTWHVMGLFAPVPVAVSEVEAAFAAGGAAGVRQKLAAEVQELVAHAEAP
jgi:hypothetical protein